MATAVQTIKCKHLSISAAKRHLSASLPSSKGQHSPVQTSKDITIAAAIMPGDSKGEQGEKNKKKECGHKCQDKATCGHKVCCKRHLNLTPQAKGKGRGAHGAATPAAKPDSAAVGRKIKVKKEPAPAPPPSPPPSALRRVEPPGGAQGGARARHFERLASVIQDIARRGSKSGRCGNCGGCIKTVPGSSVSEEEVTSLEIIVSVVKFKDNQ